MDTSKEDRVKTVLDREQLEMSDFDSYGVFRGKRDLNDMQMLYTVWNVSPENPVTEVRVKVFKDFYK